MNSNLQWQQHHVEERLRSRRNEAQWQRLIKQGAPQREPAASRAWNWFSNLLRRRSRPGSQSTVSTRKQRTA